MFEVLNFGVQGVVIVMLLRPLTVSGELSLMGVLTSMWQPPSLSLSRRSPLSFSSRRFQKIRLPATPSGTEGTYHSEQETTSLSSIKRVFCMTTYAKYIIFRRLCFLQKRFTVFGGQAN